MLDLIVIVIIIIIIITLIVSLAKPDILLSKKMKEKATDEQKNIFTKNLRKLYAIMVVSFGSLTLMRYTRFVGSILAIVSIILFFVVAVPANKENSRIKKELN